MMKKYFVILMFFLLTACGTVFDGTGQMISFESNVKAVQVYIDGVKVCTTPCSYDVDRSVSDLEIEARKKGYQTQRMKLRANFNRISIFNLIGWPSWTTDVAMGGAWEYKNNHIYFEMEKSGYRSAKVENDTATRRFALFGYDELKNEAAKNYGGEFIKTLIGLTGKTEHNLITIIDKANNEVNLAHNLTGIE